MKESTKEVFENNVHRHNTMKKIDKAYLNKHEYSAQETFYHFFFPEFKLRRIFLAVYFINIDLPKDYFQVLLSEKELSPNSPNIFKKHRILRRIYAEFFSILLT